MYSIYADGTCIYNDVFAVEDMKAIEPELIMEDNAAGSLSVTLTPANAGYKTITHLVSDISVEKDGKEIWAGRVLSESKDFYNNRVLYCEGELAFLNDSTQPPAEYPGYSMRQYVERLLAVHNSKVAANRRFAVGAVTVHDDDYPTFYTNHENTMEIFNNLVEKYGGHIRVRKENGIRYLDYLEDFPNTCSQAIQFGKNMIDFTRQWDLAEFATVIVPLGNRLDESPIEALDAYLTVESVNGGSIYVRSAEAVAAYGWIEKTVTWNDVDDASALLSKARAYLSDLQFDNMVLELSALDLHYLDVNYEAVHLLDEIRVISRPHGLDRVFPVTKLEIPLDSPEKTQFKLGTTVRTSLTGVNNQTNTAILQKIEALPKAHSLLKEAKENATAIMNMATTGYITITKNEYGSDTLYISNVQDYTKADKLWKWNMNGLGYSRDGGKTYGLAITMDGSIVADYITSGVMNADLIRAGKLQDVTKTNFWDLKTGEFQLASTVKVGNSTIAKASDLNSLVVSTDVEYGNSDSSAKKPSTWTTNAEWKQGKYLWTRTKMKLEDGSIQYSEARIIANGNGLGVSKVTEQYYLSTSKTTQAGGSWSEMQPTWVKGRYYWTRSKIDWADGTSTYTAPVLANALTSGNQSTNDLDDSFNQKKVFDRLTNNGEKQGIYLSDGKLYINAEYIATGTLADRYSNVVFNLETGAFTMRKGSIKLGEYANGHYQFEVICVDDNPSFYFGSSAIFAGTLNAAKGTFGGQLVAASGNFKGIVQASDFLDASGKSMMTDGKFSSSYLDLGNIQLDGTTGDITMTGNLNLSKLSSINWGSSPPIKYQYSIDGTGNWHNTMNTADKFRRDSFDGGKTWSDSYQFRAEDGKDGSDAVVPTYIRSTYIDQTTIMSPNIFGGVFYATGKGRNNGAAYYITNGFVGNGSNAVPNKILGYISYDDHGSGTTGEAKERVYFGTSIAMKLQAGTNMSISAGDSIYVMSPLRIASKLIVSSDSYGTSLPSTGDRGQVFFLISE